MDLMQKGAQVFMVVAAAAVVSDKHTRKQASEQ